MPVRVSVSLVTFNGGAWLDECLRSLAVQTLADYELLVFDNASTDASVGLVRAVAATDDRVALITSSENLGYSAGHNRNIFRAQGEVVVLVNQDVVLDARFIEAAVAVLDARPRVGAVQGLIRRLGPAGERTTTLDTTGLYMHRDRRVVARHQGDLEQAFDRVPGTVWGVDGPAAVIRRSALLEAAVPRASGRLEVLDEDFFMYKEDVDLAWRLRTLGWDTWYEPAALAWHARTARAGRQPSWFHVARSRWMIPPWIRRVSWRNQRLMQIKNETSAGLLRDFPWIARREIASFAFMVLFDPARVPAIVDLVRIAPLMRPKRDAIRQSVRKRRQQRSE